MTIVCAVEDGSGVVMACDEQASTPTRKFQGEASKLFRNGEYLFGTCGDIRMAQLLRYSLEPPYVDTWDVDRHIATRFIDSVRSCFEDGGWQRTEDGAARGGNFLVAVKGRVYEIEDNYQFFRNAEGIYTIGSGNDVAVGAMHALREREAEARVRAGVEAAIAHTTSCGFGVRVEWALP